MFFDSSAFAKRYILESGSETVDALCAKASELAVSIVCIPEIFSTLARLKRETKLSLHQYHSCKESFITDINDSTICNLTQQVLSYSLHALEQNHLKAMDALHIGCALEWQADLFISSDKQQLVAAKKMGLSVLKAE